MSKRLDMKNRFMQMSTLDVTKYTNRDMRVERVNQLQVEQNSSASGLNQVFDTNTNEFVDAKVEIENLIKLKTLTLDGVKLSNSEKDVLTLALITALDFIDKIRNKKDK